MSLNKFFSHNIISVKFALKLKSFSLMLDFLLFRKVNLLVVKLSVDSLTQELCSLQVLCKLFFFNVDLVLLGFYLGSQLKFGQIQHGVLLSFMSQVIIVNLLCLKGQPGLIIEDLLLHLLQGNVLFRSEFVLLVLMVGINGVDVCFSLDFFVTKLISNCSGNCLSLLSGTFSEFCLQVLEKLVRSNSDIKDFDSFEPDSPSVNEFLNLLSDTIPKFASVLDHIVD